MGGADSDKQRLRSELLAARRARSSEALAAARAAIREHVLFAADGGVACVAAYEPMRTEPGSVELLAGLRSRGVQVLVPVTLPDRSLDWVAWGPDGPGPRLGPGAIGSAELVLAPALAVAVDGTRLGRGGGSYDRALSVRADGSVVAALVFADEIVPALPRDPWDVPVTHAVTPDGWRALAGNADFPLRR